jgi:recombination protein RecA
MTTTQNVPSAEDRRAALEAAIQGLDKRYGKGALMRLGERPVQEVETIPTGAVSLDLALGVGGYPRGRVVEIYGPEASGKTTLTLHAIAEVQRRGGTAAFIDAEHALDVAYARALGVDVDALLVAQPDSGEQALEIAEALVRSGAVELVVVDSVAALVPMAELEGQMGDAHMGLQARLMSQALRKITGVTNRTGTTVIFINQVRQKIGVTFGNGETTTGGNALKFYASVRLDIRRIGNIQDKDQTVGARTRVKVVKNKLAPPFRSIEIDVMFGRGFCKAGDLLDLAEESGVVEKSGSWYAMGDTKLGQGRERVRERLLTEPALFAQIEAAVRASEPGVGTAEA